jgi:hypothetical protein
MQTAGAIATSVYIPDYTVSHTKKQNVLITAETSSLRVTSTGNKNNSDNNNNNTVTWRPSGFT